MSAVVGVQVGMYVQRQGNAATNAYPQHSDADEAGASTEGLAPPLALGV